MRGKSGEMERGVPRRRRPRPVVTEGVEALLLRGDELAKGWLLALVEDAPLESAAAIMAGDVARDGPRICDAVVRAIYDEADLRRIEAGGVLEPLVSRAGELAGVRTSEGAAHAVEALRSVIWSALRTELARTDPDLLADAGERLSLVAELVRTTVLRRLAESEPRGAPRPRVPSLRVARTDVPPSAREGGDFENGGAPDQGIGDTLERGRGDALERGNGDALWIGALRDEIVPAARVRASLTVSVGLAVLGEDGHNAATLIDAAEHMRFAAEASGIGIVTDEPGEGGTEPPTPGPTLVS